MSNCRIVRTQRFRRANILEAEDGGGSGGRGCPDSDAFLHSSIASSSLSLLISFACDNYKQYVTLHVLSHVKHASHCIAEQLTHRALFDNNNAAMCALVTEVLPLGELLFITTPKSSTT